MIGPEGSASVVGAVTMTVPEIDMANSASSLSADRKGEVRSARQARLTLTGDWSAMGPVAAARVELRLPPAPQPWRAAA